MNLTELNAWMKSAKFVESANHDTDSCGNYTYSRIYEKDGGFWRIEFMNNHPSEKWGKRGYVRGVYEPKPVHKVGWMEYRCEWVEND